MPEHQPKQPRRRILSVPLSPEQRAELELRAGRQPISAYARAQLFAANDNNKPTKIPRSHPAKAIPQALANLGPSATALKQIASGIASGVVPLSPDTEVAIIKACHDIADMKSMLMKALGIPER